MMYAAWPEFWQTLAQFVIAITVIAAVVLSIAAFVKWLVSHH